jgi:hypothetical protein
MGASGQAYEGHALTLISPDSVGQFRRPKRFKKLPNRSAYGRCASADCAYRSSREQLALPSQVL